jgi:hypothetical protein
MAELTKIQLSFVYVETILDVLTGAVKKPPYSFLTNRFDWATKFDASTKRDGPIQPPWPDRAGRGFWAYYFEQQRPLEAIKGDHAWHGVAPMRQEFPFSVKSTDERLRPAPEAFIYPHGAAVVINVALQNKFTPEETAALASDVRRQPIFTIDADTTARPLDAVAARALDALRETAFGASVGVGRRPHFPFSVATVIVATGGDEVNPPADGSPEHRFLDAVTTWSPTWKSAALGKVADRRLDARTEGVPGGHIVYRRDRGRAIWFPGSFNVPAGYIRTLTCYHRNLVLASLQVESLAGLAAATAAFLADGGKLNNPHFDAARRAGNVLGRFYGGARTIYRSHSPKAQIDDAGYVSDINAMRAAVGQVALFG